jgi:ADP-ribosylglycohydrolase
MAVQDMTNAAPTLHDRYVGCLVGSALGDALGRLTEHIDYDTILYQFGPTGIKEPPAKALYTDDTQLAMATARALIAGGGDSFARLMDAVTREYVAWYHSQNSPIYRRAPGMAVIDALARVARGSHYSVAGDGGANDSIVATRAVPVALRFHGDIQKIIETAAEVSRMTHGHPAAISAGAASALFVEYALNGLEPKEWFARYVGDLRKWCPDAAHETIEAIRTTERTLGWMPEDAMERQFHSRPGYGGGWSGEEAVSLGLWCFMHSPTNYVSTVRLGANAYGESDTDSIAAVAGAFSGAYNGIQGIPTAWVDRLEDGAVIRALSDQLYEIRTAETVPA